MKNKYLKNMTGHLMMWMLSFLCLAGSQRVMAQKTDNSSSAVDMNSSQKPEMPLTTKSGANTVSVNGTEYDTWVNAINAINADATETSFNIILLNHVMDAKVMPNKACTISGATPNTNFAYVNAEGNLTRIQLNAALTFKNITLQIWQIAANGYALTFEEGVNVISQYKLGNDDIGYTNITGIRNLWGGTDNSNNVASTNITIKSGQFGWIVGGNCNGGEVTEVSKITISGGTINQTVFGGGYNGTCGSTEVKITGGAFKDNIYGGGEIGIVNSDTYVEIDGAKMDPDEISPGTFSGGSIYGGGFGQDGENGEKGKVGSTKVVIKGIAPGSKNVIVYGGGLHSKVTGDTDVTIEGGDIKNVYAGGYNYNLTTGLVGGNVNLLIKGGTIEVVGAARGQDNGAVIPVTGTMNITIEGGVVKNYIRSGNESFGSEYKACTLTIKNLGSENSPYILPGVYAVSNLILDNSTVKFNDPESIAPFVYNLYGFTVMEDYPLNISGNGKLAGSDILVISLSNNVLSPNKPVVVAENLPTTTTFAGYVKFENNKPVTTPIYKAGKTYRLKKDSETLYTVGITAPETEGVGTVTVKWDQFDSKDVMLEDGDQVPGSASITPKATPNDAGITAILKNGEAPITSGSALTLSANASFHGEFEILPLDLDGKNEDITISKAGEIWKYTKAAITKALPAQISFNGTVKNTLADSKRVLINETAQGALTFESAKINSTTTAAPALTIANGAKVSFSGNLEVKSGEASQYGIENNGDLVITGASTTIASTNTTSGSDKGIKVGSNASVLSEADTKLTTSGMANDGTVVIKEGAIAETTTGTALQKTYLVNVTDPGNGNKLVIIAGSDIEVGDQDKVADKTKLKVGTAPTSGYQLEAITVTPKGGSAVKLENNSLYEMPESEVTFAATFKQTAPPYIPTYYSVNLPATEGVTFTPKAGSYVVEEGYNFTFSLVLNEGYTNSKPVVKANDAVIDPRESDGKYIIRNINETMNITIEGITKDDPTGNAEVEGHVKVQAIGSILHIYLPKEETVRVYTLSSLLYKEQELAAGDTRMQLTNGIYLVKVGDNTYKIVIR